MDEQTLDLKIQQIMKGSFSHFMQKEIFEQPDSVVNTMRGRVRKDDDVVKLGGLVDYIADIKRCRRLLFVACGTSYNSAIATRQFIEEVSGGCARLCELLAVFFFFVVFFFFFFLFFVLFFFVCLFVCL